MIIADDAGCPYSRAAGDRGEELLRLEMCVLFRLLQHENKLRCSATRMLKLSPQRPVHGVLVRGGLIPGCGCADLRGSRQRKPPSSQSSAHRCIGRLSIQVGASVAISSIKRAASSFVPVVLSVTTPAAAIFSQIRVFVILLTSKTIRPQSILKASYKTLL